MKPTKTSSSNFSKVQNFGKAAKLSLTIIPIFIINLLNDIQAQNVGVNTTGATPDSKHLLEVLQPSITDNSVGIYVKHSGADATKTLYGFQSIRDGAGLVNVAAYLQAINGTSNYALIVPSGGGNVGIGTTNPSALFHLVSPIANDDIRFEVSGAGEGGNLRFQKANGSPSSRSIVANGDNIGEIMWQAYDGSAFQNCAGIRVIMDATPGANDVPSSLVFRTTPDGSSTLTEWMRLTNSGNVGIGTSSPSKTLDIGVNGTATPATGGLLGIGIINEDLTANALSGIIFRSYDDGGIGRHGGAIVAGKTSNWVGGSGNYPGFISFWTRPFVGNQAERMRITDDGNVGIGTTAPTTELQVNGTISSPVGTDLTINSQAGAFGNVIITDNLIPLVNNTSDFGSATKTWKQGFFSGNVGIGSTAPSEKLDVVGNVRFSGALMPNNAAGTAGQVLTSAGAGVVPTWTTPTTGDITDVTAGTGLTGGGASGALTVNAVGGNGLTESADDIDLGGALDQATTITQGANLMLFDLNSTGDFHVRANAAAAGLFVQQDGNVGIGSTTPGAKLDIVGYGSFGGNYASFVKTGTRGLLFNNAYDIEWLGSTFGSGYGHRLYSIDPGGNTQLRLAARQGSGSWTDMVTFSSIGNVGIGTISPAHKLHVIGTAGLSTGTAWTNTSDIRLKDIRGRYEKGLKEIVNLKTVRFNYKENNPLGLPSDKEIIGFIAQEVQKEIPEAVITREDGYLELNVDPIHWASINAIKELNQKIERLEKENIILKDENSRKVTKDDFEKASAQIINLEVEISEIKAILNQNSKK